MWMLNVNAKNIYITRNQAMVRRGELPIQHRHCHLHPQPLNEITNAIFQKETALVLMRQHLRHL